MKERPILLNTENVISTLEGRKTQTRRALKPQPKKFAEYCYTNPKGYLVFEDHTKVKCPYGKIGDILNVAENTAKAYWDAMVKTDKDLSENIDSIISDVETTSQDEWESQAEKAAREKAEKDAADLEAKEAQEKAHQEELERLEKEEADEKAAQEKKDLEAKELKNKETKEVKNQNTK